MTLIADVRSEQIYRIRLGKVMGFDVVRPVLEFVSSLRFLWFLGINKVFSKRISVNSGMIKNVYT